MCLLLNLSGMVAQDREQWIDLPIEYRRDMLNERVVTERKQRLVPSHSAGFAGGQDNSRNS